MQNARRAHKIRLCGHLRRYKKIVKKTYIILLKIIYKLCLVWMDLKKCTIKIEYLQEVIEDHLKN